MGPKRTSARSKRERQTKLAFSPLPASSPAAVNLSPSVRNRAAAVGVDSSPSRPTKKRKVVQHNDDSDSDIGLLMPNKSFSTNFFSPAKKDLDRGMRLGLPVHSQRNGMFGSEDSEEGDSISDNSSSEEERPPVKQGKRKAQKKRKRPSGNNNPSEEEPETDGAKQRRPPAAVSAIKQESEEPEESEDAVYPTSTRRLRVRRPTVNKKQELDDEEGEEQGDSERDGTAPAEDDEGASSDNERRELEEELKFLQSSPPSSRDVARGKSRPLSARQKALEALKRRRAKVGGSSAPSSSATPGRRRAIVESDSDLEVIEENEDEGQSEDSADGATHSNDEEEEIEEEESGQKPTACHKKSTARDIFEENDEDAGFIVDDSDEPIGEPADGASMPLEFTSLALAKPRELFKYAVEWMVHKKINPGFSSTDEIYTLAFRKLDDEVKGLAQSKFSSSAWTIDFTRALRARPEIHIDEISRLQRSTMDAHCEACNRKSHPATWTIMFTGNPYNKDTLEPLSEDSDSSSESDSSISGTSSSEQLNGEKPTYDEQGERIPPESKVFTVGSTCKANAEMAHILHHWRYHLNFWVVEYLERKGYCTPEELVKRDKLSTRKRTKQANRIVDRMEKEKEISRLHKKYKEQVNHALQAKNDFSSGWGRR
ncbi:uncharacterized protein EI97DRAFT_436379 [Westerdykella ornata]|uniref:DUF4211 domain-containing protein n=1 Tax=Westerdykella ornata TaxID=318751 RepID=A0A6A6JBX6_WESOR|nr:uncharacterized protein EI97DRAFT_436379 [Westerdykella ornata]KAF2273136.1 hypothetical protein EI97DRAFT_436379 [Westerdykella ornata]